MLRKLLWIDKGLSDFYGESSWNHKDCINCDFFCLLLFTLLFYKSIAKNIGFYIWFYDNWNYHWCSSEYVVYAVCCMLEMLPKIVMSRWNGKRCHIIISWPCYIHSKYNRNANNHSLVYIVCMLIIVIECSIEFIAWVCLSFHHHHV